MMPLVIHAARPGLRGEHRTDRGARCPCDPWQLVDLNEPGRIVVVHRPFTSPTERAPEPVRSGPPAGGRSPSVGQLSPATRSRDG
jgi:hypothetical protein